MQINIECKSCGATGIYHGFAEGDGVGVVCHNCKGTGCVLFNYDPFRSKKLREDIEIVFKTAVLYKLEKNSEGGITYQKWFKNPSELDRGHEDRGRTCPLLYYQNVNFELTPKWEECKCLVGCMSITSCIHYPNKDKCWERWDRENKVT